MRLALAGLAVLSLLVPVGLAAQELATSEGVPAGWMMRLDRPSAAHDMVEFRVMEPGWHVTTGRAGAAIFWQPETTASGTYTARTTLHLFDPASHAESFGLFIAGQELEAPDQQYLYFLVRQTGEYLIKRRVGTETADVVGWTGHEAIPEMAPGAEEATQYDLAIAVGASDVAFQVNGATVHTLPRSEVRTDGVVGLRVNHMLDLHVEALEITDPM